MTQTIQTIDRTGNIARGQSARVIRKVLQAGQAVPEHNHPGEQVLLSITAGSVRCELAGEVQVLRAGTVVQFDGSHPVRLSALSDGAEFLVFLFQP